MGGILPGGLKIKRRAKLIYDQLVAGRGRNQSQPYVVNGWLIVYAMAMNEENAAGGRVVSSPTNGAAGVVSSSSFSKTMPRRKLERSCSGILCMMSAGEWS